MQDLTSQQVRALREIGDTPFPVSALRSLFAGREIWRIAKQLADRGILIRLKRDLFIQSPELLGHPIERLCVANRICSPSYVSREAALSHYGLIPEHVVNVTSSRLGRSVEFQTPIGCFQYEHVDERVYPLGLREEQSGHGAFLCAGPEKALYDLMIFRSGLNIRSRVEMRRFLFEDLRLDMEDRRFDASVFDELMARGHKTRMISILKEVLCGGEI